MKHIRIQLLAAALLAAGATPSQATNGYFLPGFGIKSMGVGGAGIALQQDALAHAANPANAAYVGSRADLGATFFNPERWSATGDSTGLNAGPDTGGFNFNQASQSKIRFFLMPDMAMTMDLSDDLTFGFAMVGSGGMNTTYKQNIFGFGNFQDGGAKSPLGVDLMQVLMPLTLAYKITPEQSIGASLTLAMQTFRAQGLGRFVQFRISTDPKHLTNKGYNWSFGGGLRLGYLGKFMDDRVTIGASWASKTYMTRFEEYQGLFAEHGDFDIPMNYGLGIAVKPMENLTAALDIVKIQYTGVKSVANPGPGVAGGSGVDETTIINDIAGATASTHPMGLGAVNGMGFGWKDMIVYKVGLIYDYSDQLTLRAGYNYGEMPIREDQAVFSALAPAVVEHHYSLGFTYKWDEAMELSGFVMHVANNDVVGTNQAVVNQVAYRMHQNIVGVGFGYKF